MCEREKRERERREREPQREREREREIEGKVRDRSSRQGGAESTLERASSSNGLELFLYSSAWPIERKARRKGSSEERKSIERRRRIRKKLHPSSLSRPSTASPAVPLRTHDKASAAPARVGIRARAVLELWAAALWVLSRPHRRSNSLLVPLPPLQKPRPPSFSLLSLSLPSLFRSHAAPFPTSSNLSCQKQGPASSSVLSLAGER